MAPKVYVTRKEHFNAAHKLYNPNWTQEKNVEVFGPCANHNWHGHNFELIVTVAGTPNVDTGFVVDFKVLGKIINEKIIEKVDHKNLNLDVDFLKEKMATCEVFAVEIWNILEDKINSLNKHAKLHCVKLIETPGNYVEYYGEQL